MVCYSYKYYFNILQRAVMNSTSITCLRLGADMLMGLNTDAAARFHDGALNAKRRTRELQP